MQKSTAAAYYRTSSASNVGADKDSLKRQQEAVTAYAKSHGILIVQEYYDAAVSGADPINERPGFSDMLSYLHGNGARIILVESASRFARDLAVQITGHELLKRKGIELVPVDAPDHFTNETPTAIMVRQILGAVSQFEKASLVEKLRKARERKRIETGRCEGRKPVPDVVVKEAKRLYRKNPRTGKRRSLRTIAKELAELGHLSVSGKPYGAESVKQMVVG
ncbi:MAG: recombinase family protein [Sneathiella sp.]|nr:recombinase family protein [Sneathiella sp.]